MKSMPHLQKGLIEMIGCRRVGDARALLDIADICHIASQRGCNRETMWAKSSLLE
jgi:hypothetical protein